MINPNLCLLFPNKVSSIVQISCCLILCDKSFVNCKLLQIGNWQCFQFAINNGDVHKLFLSGKSGKYLIIIDFFCINIFVGNLVGAIVNNMKDYLKSASKKIYIYSAVSNKFLLYVLSHSPQLTLTFLHQVTKCYGFNFPY